ncbi:MotA/TolQ/ExbB proton channel family protein [Thermosulfurimonas sp. F29]|uniref:MotA/TolQ/ExbB proton channel family protein n=1 Tax=Thermosulfurimonas sp. F29 TaxID=2867247 RepID=UPI001C832082|nr:MotA/TolQ/ExbB proton channel family protein [Thermosulfurimonas sp. F29]MBX6423110.1 MotA/TolQ/ExbB proton channel family protein [Thermosulfurimonas sp. F29]
MNWLFEKGGLVMGPLAAVSVLGVAVFLERLFYLLLAPRGARELAERVAERILTDGLEAARAEAARASGPVARMLHEGLSLGETDPEVTEKLLSFAAERELESLSRGFGFLALMANVAPLLGLLGTVLGMIRAFQTVEALGARVTPSDLAGGIWEAMLTTAVGLTVAIPLMVGLSLLEGRLARIRAELEEAGAVVLKALHERTRHA